MKNHYLPATIALGLFACLSSQSGWAATPAPVSTAELIQRAGILKKGTAVTVSVSGVEAIVRTALDRDSKRPIDDAKIDAVLIAKKVLDAEPKVSRVKVIFYDPFKYGAFIKLTITAGDVSAFGLGTLSVEKLLDSLDVIDGRGDLKEAHQILRKSSWISRVSQQRLPRAVTAAPLSGDFEVFSQMGASFRYPKDTKLEHDTDKDTMVRVEGKFGDEQPFHISLTNPTSGNPEFLARLIEVMALKQAKGYRSLAYERIKFGSNRQIDGTLQRFVYISDDTPMEHTWVYFRNGQKTQVLRMAAPESQSARAHTFFEQILAGVNVSASSPDSLAGKPLTRPVTSSSPLSRNTAAYGKVKTAFRTYNVSGAGISFDYPSELQVKEHPDKDTLVKVSGPFGSSMIEISLSKDENKIGSPQLLSQALDEMYWSHMPRYKKIRHEDITFGRDRTDGVVCITSGTSDNHPLLLQNVCFRTNDGVYTLTLTTVEGERVSALSLFNTLLSSVRAR